MRGNIQKSEAYAIAHKQSNRQRANGSICQAFRKAAAPSALPYSQTDHHPIAYGTHLPQHNPFGDDPYLLNACSRSHSYWEPYAWKRCRQKSCRFPVHVVIMS